MIKGMSHITLIVKDLEKTSDLLQRVLDAELVYSSGDEQFSLSREMFFIIGGIWIAIMEGESTIPRCYNHIAFEIADQDYERYKEKLLLAGVELRPERPRVEGEGRSIYFYDYDNHLFELHTGTLKERLKRYAQRP
jgi:catechol 2,3-dioxygenase-like lactoylglutathione lyase family enzyme